jgi:hypothetical protein
MNALLLLLIACGPTKSADTAAAPSTPPTDTDEPTETGELVDTVETTETADTGETEDTQDTQDTEDTAPPPVYPDLPTAGCGAPPYSWQPLGEMGQVVAWEEEPAFAFTAGEIDALMGLFGLGDFTPVPYGVRVAYVRYTTQDRGERVEASAIVSFPDVSAPTDVPVLLYAHPTMGFTDMCAPSAVGLQGAAFNIVFASLGLAVATPDYLGMNGYGDPAGFLHPWVGAEPTAIASLDSVRALVGVGEAGAFAARPDLSRTLFWGASEGGFGALWAERYAHEYAPELTPIATVAAVPPTDMVALSQAAATSLMDTTWGLAASLTTLTPWYGDTAPLSDALTDEAPHYLASSLADAMAETCDGFGEVGSITTVEGVLQAPFAEALRTGDLASAEPFSCFMEESTLSNPRIPLATTTPTLIVIAEEDELVLPDPVRDSIPELCDLGMVIEHVECASADHVDGALQSVVAQWEWIQARLAGEALVEPCVIHEPIDCGDAIAF